MRHFFTALLLLGITAATAEELKISAKRFETDEKKGYTLFQGNVHILKSRDELNASRVTVYVDKERKPTKFVAEGNVAFRITTETGDRYSGRAEEVRYLPVAKEYHFYRDVTLKQLNKPKTITGDEVVVDLGEGRAFAKGAGEKPVMMIFNINDANQSHD